MGREDFREYNGKTLIGEKCETPGNQRRGGGGKLVEQNRQLNHPEKRGISPFSRESDGARITKSSRGRGIRSRGAQRKQTPSFVRASRYKTRPRNVEPCCSFDAFRETKRRKFLIVELEIVPVLCTIAGVCMKFDFYRLFTSDRCGQSMKLALRS